MTAGTGFERLAAGVVALLAADPPIADVVERSRGRALPDGTASAVVVRLRGSTAEGGRMAYASVVWSTQVLVECYASKAGNVGGESLIDALLLAVHDRLASDPTLGGLAQDSEVEQIAWDIDSTDVPAGGAGLLLAVRHRTPAGSIS